MNQRWTQTYDTLDIAPALAPNVVYSPSLVFSKRSRNTAEGLSVFPALDSLGDRLPLDNNSIPEFFWRSENSSRRVIILPRIRMDSAKAGGCAVKESSTRVNSQVV